MKITIALLLTLFSISAAEAQAPNQLSAVSDFLCISGNPNLVAKFTKSGYRLVSEGAAKDAIRDQKDAIQSNIDPLKNVLKEISKGKSPKKGVTNAINKLLKKISGNKLKGNKETKLAVLSQAIATVKGLAALKKIELQALSDCVHNRRKAALPPGSTVPRVVVVRYPGGEGIAVFAVVERDSRLFPAGAYCAKKNSEPAFEIQLSTDPCPSGLSAKSCDGLLGANKVGRSIGFGAIYDSPPGEAVIQGKVGEASEQVASFVYQVKRGEQGKTCGQVFGGA